MAKATVQQDAAFAPCCFTCIYMARPPCSSRLGTGALLVKLLLAGQATIQPFPTTHQQLAASVGRAG